MVFTNISIRYHRMMHTWPEEPEFYRRILARPDDDAPRLIFADFLDEHGDPRGEWIRVQCALAFLPADDPERHVLAERERLLREQYEMEWTQPLHGLVSGCEFRRGILECVSLSGKAFLDHGAELFRRAPIRWVRLFDAAPYLSKIVQSPTLRLVRELDLCGNDLGNAGTNVLSRSAQLHAIESLDLSFNDLSDVGVQVLAREAKLPALRRLNLSENARIGAVGVTELAHSGRFGRLMSLDLSGNDLDDAAIRALTQSQQLPALSAVSLHANHIGDAGLTLLAAAPLLGRMLRRSGTLDLRDNGIGPVGLTALANSRYLPRLEQLDLSGNLINDRGLDQLLRSPNLTRLHTINLTRNRLTDSAAAVFAESPRLMQFRRIDLRENGLTATGIELIRSSPHFNWQTVLDVFVNLQFQPRSVRSPRRPSGSE